MKRLLKYFIFLSIAILIGITMTAQHGYVLIAYGNTVFEMTIWVGLLLLIVIFGIVYLILRTGNFVYRGPKKIKNYVYYYTLAKSQRYINRGLLRLIEKNWLKAEKHFIKAIILQPKHRSSLMAYLAVSYVFNIQKKYTQRDMYLSQAQQYYGNRSKNLLTINLFKQYLLMHNQQYDEALAFICTLRKSYPRHKILISNLLVIYSAQKNWENLKKLLPLLRKYQLLPNDEYIELQHKIYVELWSKCLQSNDKVAIISFWRKLSYDLRYYHEIASLYIDFLVKNYSVTKAEHSLIRILEKNWHPQLINQYGLLQSQDAWRQLKKAEMWLKKYPHEKELFLALSRICERLNLVAQQEYYFNEYNKLI